MAVPILILAGGASSRMGGRDKLLGPVQGRPLLRLVTERALAVSVRVLVVLRPGFPDRGAALAGLAVETLEAPEALEGMSGSLRAGIARLRDAPHVLLVLPDLVEVTADDMARVIAASDAQPGAQAWRGATAEGAPGHPILFDRALFPRLLALRGDTGGREVLKSLGADCVLVPLPGSHARRDLDTPQDWDDWNPAQR